MSTLQLSLATDSYDHVRDISRDDIAPSGIDLIHSELRVEEIFYRFTRHREWDISELSMAKYVSLRSQGDNSIIAIPVFPSRMFRHSSMYVNERSGIIDPSELVGKRIGIPEWSQTAGVYGRSLLVHEYNVPLASVEWVQAGVNEPGREEKLQLRLPDGVSREIVKDHSLDEMLCNGTIDAIMTARAPDSFFRRGSGIQRLFTDLAKEERSYWLRTGIFPIMHTVVVRRPVLDAHPWVAMNLFMAFERAKQRSLERLQDITVARFPLAWLPLSVEASQRDFGDDFWPYGKEENRQTLEAFLGYAYEQGVCHDQVPVDELFPEATNKIFKV